MSVCVFLYFSLLNDMGVKRRQRRQTIKNNLSKKQRRSQSIRKKTKNNLSKERRRNSRRRRSGRDIWGDLGRAIWDKLN